ncbi:MAG: fibrobacter succinogenes major paralogous domain-containing protein [Flavobacterium sp.]|uniref:fibrobacter succinogenes major paralogous domain-containing protein n=1 Tax=Flavobacterium sp. TaxID=239 RepID=UPI003BD847BD
MKKLFTLLVFAITLIATAQAPQGFNYQATVRNSSGALVVNQNVYFKFNIMLNTATSVPVFSETHYVPTDDLGQVNIVIGTGTPTTGTFSSINWGSGSYFLGIELNTGTGYVAMGTTQLLSVPYALYANSSGNAQAPTPDLATVLAVNNGANNSQIKNLADPTDAQDAVTKSYTDTSDAQLQNQISTLQAQIIALQNAIVAPLPNVTIGTQIWSTTNLDVTTYRDGTPIPQVTDPAAWAALTTGAWCYYNNDPVNGGIYGKLYNWYAVAGIHDTDPSTPNKVLAPIGWHVASYAEWDTLSTFLGGYAVAGGKMKSTGTIQVGTGLWESPNTGATNDGGFNALPGGYRSNQGDFYNINNEFWISLNTIPYAFRNLRYDRSEINSPDLFGYYNHFTEKAGASIRCIKD